MNRIALAYRAPLVFIVFLLALACANAVAAPAWTQLIGKYAAGSPDGRYTQTAVFNPVSDRMIMFGGTGNIALLNDTWVLDHADGVGGASNWTQLVVNNSPPGRYFHSTVYDVVNNRMIVFGGFATSYYCGGEASDTWVLSNADGTGGTLAWTQLATGSGPSPRYGNSAVYDPASNTMTVFGNDGFCGGGSDEIWVLSHANGLGGSPAWTQLSPPAPAPLVRFLQTAVYNTVNHRMIVFGGMATDGSYAQLNDVWVLNNANGVGAPSWTPLVTNGTPPSGRSGQTAVYDQTSNTMIVYAGCTNAGCPTSDTWMLSNADGSGGTPPAWTQLNPAADPVNGTPAIRFGHTAVYNPLNNKMIVFSGANFSDWLNDTWVLSDANPNHAPINIPVRIDIRPRTAVNRISLLTGTDIPVAILSSASFDATTQVDRTSLTFGHAGTEASFISCDARATDVNADGYKDLVCHFNGTQAGFVLGDTTGYLQGKTLSGGIISGSDSVVIIK